MIALLHYKELKQKIAYLTILKKLAKREDLKLINDTLKVLTDLFNYQEIPKLTPIEFLESDYLDLTPTHFMWPEIKKLAKLTTDEFLEIDGFSNVDLSDDDLTSLVHDFFKDGTNYKTYESFMKLFKDRKRNLHFINENFGFSGNIVYLPYYKEAFLQILRNHTFSDITCTIHEYGHGIQYLNNYDSNLFKGIFQEIVSMFFELISGEYFIKKGIFPKEGAITQWGLLEEFVEGADDLKNEFLLLEKIGLKEENLQTRIANYTKNNLFEVLMMCETNPSGNYIYLVGILIAIELFWIYLSDPDKAFYLLYKIMDIDLGLSEEEYYKQIQSLGINLNEHSKDFQEYIRKRLK